MVCSASAARRRAELPLISSMYKRLILPVLQSQPNITPKASKLLESIATCIGVLHSTVTSLTASGHAVRKSINTSSFPASPFLVTETKAACNGLRPSPLSFLQKEGIMAMVSTAKRVLPFAAATCNGAARAVASATMTPLTVETPPNRLLELVAKGLAAEKGEVLRGVSSAAPFDPTLATGYGSTPAPRAISVDFRQ
nr:cleavage stimulation factor subunit 50 isoform X1 [Ipomoea batatas]